MLDRLVPLFAQRMLGDYSFVSIAIAVVVIAAVVALVFVGLREMKVQVPPWVLHVLGIIAVTVVVILAIKFVATL